MSIDEMIANGKTLIEIQNELKKQVAARDEEQLQKYAREKKVKTATAKVLDALKEYFKALDINIDEKTIKECEDTLLEIARNLEKPIVRTWKKYKTVDLDEMDWLKDFIHSL